MRDIRFLIVNRDDLAWLFHTSVATIKKWGKMGLQQKDDSKFLLSDVIAWLKEQHKKELQARPDPTSLNQQQIVSFFGITRQTITAWGRAGMPRNKNGSYNLKDICRWLRDYYRNCSESDYRTRLEALQKKIRRNVRQLERFIEKEKTIL